MLIELQSDVLRKRKKIAKQTQNQELWGKQTHPTVSLSGHKKDSITLDLSLKSKYNNVNIQLVIYKLFSCSPNIPRKFIRCENLLAWISGYDVWSTEGDRNSLVIFFNIFFSSHGFKPKFIENKN